MNQDILEKTLLFDFYGELLTEHQRGIFELHYFQDMSFQEISESLCVTRQAVSGQLVRALKTLNEYEDKLNLVKKHRERAEKARLLIAGISDGYSGLIDNDELKKLTDKIMEIID